MGEDTTRKPVAFWSCNDGEERLCWTEVDEAVEDFLDGLDGRCDCPTDREQEFRDLGEITVYAWVREQFVPNKYMARDLLEWFFDSYAEELFNPEEGPTMTGGMRVAAQHLVDVIVREFVPWSCDRDPAQDVTVNALDWVREHAPEWLKGGA